MLADHVDGALAAGVQVVQRVLGGLGLREARGEAHDEERRVVVDDLKVAEGRGVGRRAVGVEGGDEGDGPRHDAADQELVVVHARPAVAVGVDGDVLLLRVRGGEERVGTAAELPVRIGDLGVGEGLGAVPGRAGGLDLLEVRVGVAFDVGFLHPGGSGSCCGGEGLGCAGRLKEGR